MTQQSEKSYRPIFFISNSTGITVETLGRSLLYQFADTRFKSHSLRFVDNVARAHDAVAKINEQASLSGLKPIILSTLVDPALREIVSTADALYLDVFDMFIGPIEREIGHPAQPGQKHAHGIVDDDYYNERIEAVNYSLKTDDGVSARDYNQASVILIGASRTGKTPTSLYLAIHYGLKAANYPIVDEELDVLSLPRPLLDYQDRLFGLLLTPERLSSIRGKRRPDSEYASLSRCQYEIRQTRAMFEHNNIPFFDVSSMSIEEVASSIADRLRIGSRTFLP